MLAVSTSASLDSAVYVSSSPSGSLKKEDTSTVTSSPAVIVRGGIVPTASGAWFAASTVTSTLCIAVRPSGSAAVTVTVAVPAATAVAVRLFPDMLAVSTSASLDSTVYVSSSPSGSLKKEDTSTVTSSPAVIVRGGIAPTASGAWFAASTVTPALCVAVRPSGSVAVTVTVAVPAATAVAVRSLPVSETDTTPASDDAAVYVSVPPSGSLKNGDTSTVTDCPRS